MTIPIFDLTRQYAALAPEVDAAIAGVLRRGRFILGAEVAAFEREFATYCGATHAVGVGSGTEALHLALAAAGVGPGDEVITVAHTAVATVAAVELAGARPVLVDVDPARYTLDPAHLTAAITPRTKAVIPVHLYGCPADLAPILEIAQAYRLYVIEDCAQAHGAQYRGRPVGSWGDCAAFSFYPTKNLGAYGDGGAVVTANAALAERMRLLREYGWAERYVSHIKGWNSRLDELQAAVLRVKLDYLDAWNAQRRALAAGYAEQLSGVAAVQLPGAPAESDPVYHLYVVRVPRREALQQFLQERGIGTAIHYPVPVHRQPAYGRLGYSLPVTERLAGEILSLPLFPELRADEVQTVCTAIRTFFNDHS
jgi:dTDP-4-amino-4,6-dideoxygalactose transaminase